MSWLEVQPGTWTRQAGENEQLIKFIGDRAHHIGLEQWSLMTYATFMPSNGLHSANWIETLKNAWKRLRFQHPSIASTPNKDGDSIEYIVPDEARLSDWIAESFSVEQNANISVRDVIASLKPSPIVTLHFLPSQRQVLLHTPHWRTDGYGAFQLLNAFFASVVAIIDTESNPCLRWGEEVLRLVPSVEDALKLQPDPTPEIDIAARQYLDTVKLLPGTVGIPYKGDAAKLPGQTSHVRLQLSEKETLALEDACQQRGVSIYSVIHAAVAAANWKKATPETRDKYYASTIRLSLRRHLPAPYSTPSVASGLYTGGYTYIVQPGQPLFEHAKQYEARYQHSVTTEFLQSRRQYAKILLQGLRAASAPPPPVSNIDVSFVKDVDGLIRVRRMTKNGVMEIRDIGLGVATLTRQPFCFYWKFRGRIDLLLWYNEAYHEEDTAIEILTSVKAVLAEELMETDIKLKTEGPVNVETLLGY